MKLTESIPIKGELKITLENIYTGEKDVSYHHNLFVTSGKEALARSMRGQTANNAGIVTYCAVGTDATPPALADTTLVAELFRKQISIASDSGNQSIFRTFYSTSEANGTLEEFGLFGETATVAPDSGTLFARTLANKVKTSADTLTVEWTVTIG